MGQSESAMADASQPFLDKNRSTKVDIENEQPDSKKRKEKLKQRKEQFKKRKYQLKERFELQKLVYTDLSNIVLLNEHSEQELQEPEKSQELQEPAQSTLENTTKLQEKLEKLQELLIQPEWKILEALVTETKNWDAVSTIPYEKSFLCHTRLQKLVGTLMSNTAIGFEFLKLIIKHFKADNERIEPNLDAPIHYAVHQLNGEFLDWLLSERKSFVNLNSRNSRKETALAILCSSYDKCMKGINKKDENPMTNDQRREKLEKIRLLIEKLLVAGADFNICSKQLKLPFELLLEHYEHDPTKTFVDQCGRRSVQIGQAIAIGRMNKSKLRVVDFYKPPMHSPSESRVKATEELDSTVKVDSLRKVTEQREQLEEVKSLVKVTEELLEICLHYNDEQSFLKYFRSFEVTQENVKKVIEAVLHTAVEQKMSECVRKIVDRGGSMIFEILKTEKNNDIVEERKNEDIVEERKNKDIEYLLQHRVELKGLLKKACLVADLSIVKMLISNMKDLQLLNDDPVLALTQSKANAAKRRPEDREALLSVVGYLASQKNIYKSKPDNSGNTPLHLALKYGFHDIAYTLLNPPNAYIGLRNRSKKTPLDYGGYEFWKNYFDSCIDVNKQRSSQSRHVLNFNLNCFKPHKAAPAALNQEMTVIRQIAESNDMKRLLMHPIIYTFIMVKWIRLSYLMYLNLLLTSATMVVFGWHSLETCSADTSLALWLKIASIFGTVLITLREALQLLLLQMSYATLENLMDIANIIGMIVVLSTGCNSLLSSLLMISFALQLTVLLGLLPFNSLSIIMYMFKTVSQNFLKSFLLFLPLIGSFIFAFYLTYNDTSTKLDGSGPVNNNGTSLNETCSSSASDFNNFNTFWDATIKTLVMTTGEFDASSIDFSGDKLILFLVFLFFAPIVILNLINGLAVSDITTIRQESELISISRKVILMDRYERGVANLSRSYNLVKERFKGFFENLVQLYNPGMKCCKQLFKNPSYFCKLVFKRFRRFLATLPKCFQLQKKRFGRFVANLLERIKLQKKRLKRFFANLPQLYEVLMKRCRSFFANLPQSCQKLVRRFWDFFLSRSLVTWLFPKPFFANYKWKIHVDLDQSRKILVHKLDTSKQKPSSEGMKPSTDQPAPPTNQPAPSVNQPASSTNQPNTETVAGTNQNNPKSKPISLSMLWGKGNENQINLYFSKVTPDVFLTLDRQIAKEALTVAERKLSTAKQPADVKKQAVKVSAQQSLGTSGSSDLAALLAEIDQLRDKMNRCSLSKSEKAEVIQKLSQVACDLRKQVLSTKAPSTSSLNNITE